MPIATLDDIRAKVGRKSACPTGSTVDQERIDAFADATEDRQFIHVDPRRGADPVRRDHRPRLPVPVAAEPHGGRRRCWSPTPPRWRSITGSTGSASSPRSRRQAGPRPLHLDRRGESARPTASPHRYRRDRGRGQARADRPVARPHVHLGEHPHVRPRRRHRLHRPHPDRPGLSRRVQRHARRRRSAATSIRAASSARDRAGEIDDVIMGARSSRACRRPSAARRLAPACR